MSPPPSDNKPSGHTIVFDTRPGRTYALLPPEELRLARMQFVAAEKIVGRWTFDKGKQAVGGTATFDGIAIAMKIIQDQRAVDPDLRPVIFVLSDGETNNGHSLSDIEDIVEDLGIPIYTIGYNANLPALQAISSINEAASINADTDDVVYKLGNLFNAEM